MLSRKFIGRDKELVRLQELHSKKAPSMVVVKGRRRIGKSRLIAEFAAQNKKNTFWTFAGLAPEEGMDDQSQRDHFARQLGLIRKMPPFSCKNWSDALEHLGMYLKSGDIILLDEISWMGHKDASFVAKLKAWWDQVNVPVTLVLCGSVSVWIEENILKSTAFFGRVNLTVTLDPLTIPESYLFLRKAGFKGSIYDTYKVLSVLGGVPWYLEQVSSSKMADTIIHQLCFEKNGLLVLEFDRIFHDLFGSKGESYRKILDVLKEGPQTLAEVRDALGFAHSGTFSSLMEHLITAGFVSKQQLWSFRTLRPGKQSLYRISDPFMRFYLKVIGPNRHKIDRGGLSDMDLSQLPGFETHVGLQIEQLLLQNRSLLLDAIGVSKHVVVADGPFRQMQTTKQRGCQIDYLVQVSTHNLFVCEFKFRRRELGSATVDEMKERIAALKVPKGFSVVPVLFHIGGVSAAVDTGGYFFRIIDMADLLEQR